MKRLRIDPEKKGKVRSKGKGIIDEMRDGRSISLEFFKRHAWFVLILLVAVLSLIGLRYKTKTRMAEIKALRNELEQAENDKLNAKAEYMTLIRESEMRRLVTEKRLPLSFQEQPPYEIIDDSQTDY